MMPDVDKTIRGLTAFLECNSRKCDGCEYQDKKPGTPGGCRLDQYQVLEDAIKLLKEQEKKQITLHKKHVITLRRSDDFSMRKLYETICETLLDEGELFIARTDDHEKVDFVFYVAEGR